MDGGEDLFRVAGKHLDSAQLNGESLRIQTCWICPAPFPHPSGGKEKADSESRRAEQAEKSPEGSEGLSPRLT